MTNLNVTPAPIIIINNLSPYPQQCRIDYLESLIAPAYTIYFSTPANVNNGFALDNLQYTNANISFNFDVESYTNTLTSTEYFTIPITTLYTNQIQINPVNMLFDLIPLGFTFASNVQNTEFGVGDRLPNTTTYTNNTDNQVYNIIDGLKFMGINYDSLGTNKFYTSFLEGVPTIVKTDVNTNLVIPFIWLPAFFAYDTYKLFLNDTGTSSLINISCVGGTEVINNSPYTIVVDENGSSYFVLANTSSHFAYDSIKLLLPENLENLSGYGSQVITLMDTNIITENIEVFSVSNVTSGVFSDSYATSHLIGNNPNNSGNSISVAMPLTTSTYVYNQTNATIEVTAESGIDYNIEVNNKDNYNMGAIIRVYPGNQVIRYADKTVVQCIDYALRPNFDLSANEGNQYNFYQDSSDRKNNVTELSNLHDAQPATNFPSFQHLQNFYFTSGNNYYKNQIGGTQPREDFTGE